MQSWLCFVGRATSECGRDFVLLLNRESTLWSFIDFGLRMCIELSRFYHGIPAAQWKAKALIRNCAGRTNVNEDLMCSIWYAKGYKAK